MGFFKLPKYHVSSEKYEQGYPDINGKRSVFIAFEETEVLLTFTNGFKPIKKVIKPDDIIEIELNQENYRSAGKAAAGAIIGGILTGGIGLLAGAALGGKRRKENQLKLIIKENNQELDIFLESSTTIPKVYAEFKRLMSLQTIKPVKASDTNDIAEQIEKLHNLLEKGILTQEEFNSQKIKLLNA